MLEPKLTPAPACSGWRVREATGLRISWRDDLMIVGLGAFRGREEALAARIAERYGVTLPSGPTRVEGQGIALQWAGPRRWLAIAGRSDGRDLEGELRTLVDGLGAVTDQGDGRAVVTVSGARASELLAKGVPIDLDERVFAWGAVAVTHMNHVGITITRIGEAPYFEILLPRSYALSIAAWLQEAGAEFGIANPTR